MVGHWVALRTGAEKLLAGAVIEGRGVTPEDLGDALHELANGTPCIAAEHHGLHEFVEALDFQAALLGLRGAAPDSLGELAGGHGGYEEGDEGDPILGIFDGKCGHRFQKVIVEAEHGNDGCDGGLGEPPARGDAENDEEEGERHRRVVDG